MTYVSRRTRIILSRWTDECDAEYSLKACRKRSDGRLKRHSSCEDLRAWIRDDHIRNEHLVDLMSDGEFLGKPPFRLYGRFIPVPILFQLGQNSTIPNANTKSNESQEQKSVNAKTKAENSLERRYNSANENAKLKGESSLTRIEWEKNLLERYLVKCTCLLNVAFEKLEKIDVIVALANQETENARIEEIQQAFHKSKLNCTCSRHQSSSTYSNLNNFSENLSSSQSSNLKKLRDSAKCNELLRKISGLRKKLTKIQERRQEILFQIRASQQKADKCSALQGTEQYNRQEEAQIKKLQEKYERLISENGRVNYEMCEALIALNTIKRSSRSCLNSRSRSLSKPKEICDDFRNSTICYCGCKCSDTYESSDSEKLHCSASSSGDSDRNKKIENLKHLDKNLGFNLKNRANFPLSTSADCGNLDIEQLSDDNLISAEGTETQQMGSKFSESLCTTTDNSFIKEERKLAPATKKKEENTGNPKTAKKSKVKFICKESPCRNKFYTDDFTSFENSLSPEQQLVIQKAVKYVKNVQSFESFESFRPNTSPTTRRERESACLGSKSIYRYAATEQSCQPFGSVPERRVKSETTMKEIEKTLRNYEQRLCDMDSLECKVEDLKDRSSEARRLRKKLAKVMAESKKQRAAYQEKWNREITRLYSENWELKKQIQQLIAMFGAQYQEIQNLKCSVLKARELECETQELKKELSEYRDSRRKCISKWESVVAMQRTRNREIENLMNHIRKLTTMKEESNQQPPLSPCQDRRYIQRSRSYSPEKIKERVAACRPKTQLRTSRLLPEEEENGNSWDYRQQEGRRKSQLRSFDRGYCSQMRKHMDWCN